LAIVFGLCVSPLGGASIVGTGAASGTATTPAMRLSPASAPATLVAEAPLRGGNVVTTWNWAQGEIKAAAPTGSRLDIVTSSAPVTFRGKPATRTTTGIYITPPPLGLAGVMAAVARDGAAGDVAYGSAIAVGMSSAQAAQDTTPPNVPPPQGVFNAMCLGTKVANDGSGVTVSGCDTQVLHIANGPPAQYWATDQQNGFAGEPPNCSAVTIASITDYYSYKGSSGNHPIVGYSPDTAIYNTGVNNITISGSLNLADYAPISGVLTWTNLLPFNPSGTNQFGPFLSQPDGSGSYTAFGGEFQGVSLATTGVSSRDLVEVTPPATATFDAKEGWRIQGYKYCSL
jgi:hypothetical protein